MKRSSTGSIRVTLAALLALAGLAVSGILLQHHVVVEVGGDPIFNNLCEVTENTSCDDVLASEWGKIGWGRGDDAIPIPTAMLGLFFFAATASWFIVIGRPTRSRRWLYGLPLLATAAGTAGCAFLAYVMFAQLDKWCPFCFAAHLLAALLFVVTLLLWPRGAGAAVISPALTAGYPPPAQERRKPAPPSAHPSFRLIAVAILLAGVTSAAAWSAYHHRLEKAYAREYFARWQEYEKGYETAYGDFIEQEQVAIPILPGDPVRGAANAPHTVVVFTDFQCPYCVGLERVLRARRKEFPGRFRIVFKHFPMNTTCNPQIKKTLYKAACAAAVTAEAARQVGGNEAFWKMHDELFDDQKAFARGSQDFVKAVTERIGIDHDELWSHIKTRSIWERIHENVEEGHAAGVKGTPTMFIDGRRMNNWGDSNFWRYLLQQEATPVTLDPPAPASRPTSRPATRAS